MVKTRFVLGILFTLVVMGMAACGEKTAPTEPIQPAATNPIQTFEQRVEGLRKELNIPGMSVAVLQGQEVVFAWGFGYADVENEVPATENTPYYIASCTKPFAAAVIMQLVEAGQLDLDAAMADILKDTTFPFPSGAIHGYAGLCETIIELSRDTSGPYAAYRSLFED